MAEALEFLSKVHDLVDLNDFMADPEFEAALELALNVIARPNIPTAQARLALAQMQGYAFKFRMQAATYTYIHTGKTGTPENIKKNVYFAVSEQCHELAQTLKYLAKEQYGA